MMPSPSPEPVGQLLRAWRQRRRLSQLELACEANVSARHLSFIETGRASPSREMLLALAEELDVPLRERNRLLVAAGYAPIFPQRPLDDPALRSAREVVEQVLRAYEPSPALAIDRHWTLVSANRAVAPFMSASDATLLQPPINVLRLSLHPAGLAPRIVNFGEWHAHVVARLRRQVEATADAALMELLREIEGYGPRGHEPAAPRREYTDVAVPLRVSGNNILD